MSVITMCRGKELDDSRECPMRRECYRATATPRTYRQRYFAKLPVLNDGTCGDFWKLEHPWIGAGDDERYFDLAPTNIWEWAQVLSTNIRDAAMLARTESGAANRTIRRLLAHIEHPSTNGHRGVRYELSAIVRTWWERVQRREATSEQGEG